MPACRHGAELLPQVVAQDRVLPDRWLVENQHRGPADERAGQGRARTLAAGEGADELASGLGEADVAR